MWDNWLKRTEEEVAEDRGVQKGKIEVARNLLSTNLPLEQIATATGLTCEDVERLRSH